MDKRKREQRKAAKKIARRKSYVKHRNRVRDHETLKKLLEKNKVKPVPESEKIDGAEWYRRYKEQERLSKPAPQTKPNFWGHVKKILSVTKKGQ